MPKALTFKTSIAYTGGIGMTKPDPDSFFCNCFIVAILGSGKGLEVEQFPQLEIPSQL